VGHPGLALLGTLRHLPLPWLRALGALLGQLLFLVVNARRRVVLTNLRLCFPHWSEAERGRVAQQVFVHFAQAWLDRSWLWQGTEAQLRQRVRLVGDVAALQSGLPTVVFAPHFVGLDVGWTALTHALPQRFTTIYTQQSNPAVDAWVAQGRQRYGQGRLFRRQDGVKAIVNALRQGEILYLLPDMNFGTEESIFVPFYGVPAATVPSLSRFARLARAQVVPVVTRMTPEGYEVEVMSAWNDFPGESIEADTAEMNRRLQGWIDTLPAQYFWVHQRFKSRPPGEPSVYAD
jgi:KDO2-lipid IV(A) lauroyltransferase